MNKTETLINRIIKDELKKIKQNKKIINNYKLKNQGRYILKKI